MYTCVCQKENNLYQYEVLEIMYHYYTGCKWYPVIDKVRKPTLLEVRFADSYQPINLPVHDEISTEIESKHLDTFITISQNNVISAETNNHNLIDILKDH